MYQALAPPEPSLFRPNPTLIEKSTLWLAFEAGKVRPEVYPGFTSVF
jgi:hypothetical protein